MKENVCAISGPFIYQSPQTKIKDPVAVPVQRRNSEQQSYCIMTLAFLKHEKHPTFSINRSVRFMNSCNKK